MKRVALALLVMLAAGPLRAQTVSPEWADRWQEDLRYVREELPKKHKNLYHEMTEQAFDAALDNLSERVPTMAHYEIVTELAAIIAMARDGHTRLTLPLVEGAGFFQGHSKTPEPKDPALLFHYYPIRLYIYSDGLFVQRIGADHAALAGARVRAIGNMTADEAMSAVAPVVQRDNDMQVKHLLPSRLTIPEILAARGVIDDRSEAEFILETRDGTQHVLLLSPVPEGTTVEWVDAGPADAPLYLRDPENKFWFEYLPRERTVFFQYNEVYDKEEESIADFSRRLRRFIETHDVDRLVIDLRFNPGGNNGRNRALLQEIIRCEQVQAPGTLYAIIGRGTFSAAMMFALDLEKQTNVIFVGEPTGARPNHYGDSRKMQLPETGLTIRASSLYWQYSDPRDERPWIPPHISAPLASEDYRLGRDPALDAILALARASAPSDVAGAWAGRVRNYTINVTFHREGNERSATIDFPEEQVLGLPMQNIRYERPRIHFELLDEVGLVSFEGEVRGHTILGGATMGGLTYPFVLTTTP